MYNYNPGLERINNQIAELEKMKAQIQTPAINQTFQLASPTNIKYANSIDDVNKEFVYGETPFFSKDFKVVWIKNSKGEIKSYELNEIVIKDDKDIMIDNLQLQIEELRKEIKNAKSNDDDVNESTKSKKSSNV